MLDQISFFNFETEKQKRYNWHFLAMICDNVGFSPNDL